MVDPRINRRYSWLWSKTVRGPETAPNTPIRKRLEVRLLLLCHDNRHNIGINTYIYTHAIYICVCFMLTFSNKDVGALFIVRKAKQA